MAKKSGVVTKIYELKTTGFDNVSGDFNKLSQQLKDIKKSWQEVTALMAKGGNSAELQELAKKEADLTRQIKEKSIALKEAKLEMLANQKAQEGASKTAANNVSEYFKLCQKYQEAKRNLQDLAAAHGAESKEAQEAAKITQGYAAQLKQINDLAKSGSHEKRINETRALSTEQIKAREETRRLNQENKNLVANSLAAANSIEKLRAELALATAKRNKLQIDSDEFKTAEKEVLDLTTRLKELESRGGDFRRNVGNYGSAFDGLRNSINQLTREAPAFANSIQTGFMALSNNIPILFDEISRTKKEIAALRLEGKETQSLLGRLASSFFSFGTALSIGVTLLTVYGKEIGEFIGSLFSGTKAMNEFSERQRILNQTLKDGSGGLREAVVNVKELSIYIDLAKEGLLNKNDVLKQYNESMGKVTGEAKNLEEAERLLTENADAYIKATLFKAAANAALEEASKKALQAELDRSKKAEEFLTTGDKVTRFGAGNVSAPGYVPSLQQQSTEAQIKFNEEQSKKRQAAAVKQSEDEVKTLDNIAKKFMKQAAEASKGLNFFTDNKGDKKYTGSRLTGEMKDSIKELDALRRQELAIENKRFNDIAAVRKVTFDEEIEHLKRIESINVRSLNQQTSLLSKKKQLNAEEKQTLAEFGEEISDIHLSTSERIQAIEKQRFERQERDLKIDLDQQVRFLEEKNRIIQEDASKSPLEKAKSEMETSGAILKLQTKFFDDLNKLNEDYSADALARARAAIIESQKALRNDRRQVSLADLQEIKIEGERKLAEQEIQFAKARKAILDNDKLSKEQKDRQLKQLEQANTRTILSQELETLNQEVAAKKKLLDESLISEEEYIEALKKQAEKAASLSANLGNNADPLPKGIKSFQQLVQGGLKGNKGLRGLTSTIEGTDGDQVIGQVIAQSFDLAQSAMNNYFDAERQRIEQSKQLQFERLDIEKDQLIARAQSQAEVELIEKQTAAKKKQIERDAFEKNKDIKKKEAKLAYLMELANIWSTAYQLGPVAGPIAGGALSALASLRYLMNMAQINSLKYEFGGKVPSKGGKFGGRPHSKGGTPFQFKGQSFEAEVDELAIIRTKNADPSRVHTLTGTQSQIASMLNVLGGGVAFDKGGKLSRFEFGGNLGENLEPPVFTPALMTVQSNSEANALKAIQEQSNALKEQAKSIQAVSDRIDRIQVIQDTNSVSTALRKKVKQTEIGTL